MRRFATSATTDASASVGLAARAVLRLPDREPPVLTKAPTLLERSATADDGFERPVSGHP